MYVAQSGTFPLLLMGQMKWKTSSLWVVGMWIWARCMAGLERDFAYVPRPILDRPAAGPGANLPTVDWPCVCDAVNREVLQRPARWIWGLARVKTHE